VSQVIEYFDGTEDNKFTDIGQILILQKLWQRGLTGATHRD